MGITCWIAAATYYISAATMVTRARLDVTFTCALPLLLKLRWFWLQEPADEVYEMLDRKKKETLAYKRSFFVRMVSDPKIYNPKIAKTLSRSRHRHVTEAGATVDNGVSIQAPM